MIFAGGIIQSNLGYLTPSVRYSLFATGDLRTNPLPHTRRPPMGAKTRPMMRRVGRTVFGVKIGCQAFRRCCLKAVSMLRTIYGKRRKD